MKDLRENTSIVDLKAEGDTGEVIVEVIPEFKKPDSTVYEKARLLMGNKPDFAQIKYIYDKKKAEIKNRKYKVFSYTFFMVGGWFLLFSILALGDCAYGTFIILLLIGLGLLNFGIKFIRVYNQNKQGSI